LKACGVSLEFGSCHVHVQGAVFSREAPYQQRGGWQEQERTPGYHKDGRAGKNPWALYTGVYTIYIGVYLAESPPIHAMLCRSDDIQLSHPLPSAHPNKLTLARSLSISLARARA
jgi:hypothetical protein